MPDEKRIDMSRDLTDEGYMLAQPLIAEMVELEKQWVSSGDEDAYQAWRVAVTRLQVIVNEHYTGRNR